MKKSGNFFLWIVLLVAGLLITITITQVVTQNSLFRLRKGNSQATTTFTMNNRLQEMVNLAFELEAKLLSDKSADLVSPKRGIKDSLTRLQYNIGVLKKLWSDTLQLSALNKLAKFVDNQVGLSFNILSEIEKKNVPAQKLLIDSLRNTHSGDSIYSSAITFQKGLEQNLSATLDQNNKASSQLSLLNRLLAGVSLLAILILATIIIRRQVKQLSLIKQLENARKIALQSVEAKDQFLANMSHEIRTPLNAIKGFGRILLDTPLNSDQYKYSSIISTASENLLNIVNDILDFSKIEAGNLALKKRTFELQQIVHEVELMFTSLAYEKELQLQFSIDGALPSFVTGDPERLRQILVNLLSNAIKFTNAGYVKMYVKLMEENEHVVKTKFSVEDSGVGIPPEKIDLIFERFEQIDHSFTRQQGGTGLGLAITKKLAEAMGGKIMVQSELNKGSIFIAELEFEKVSKTDVEKETFLPSFRVDNVSLNDVKILVAEDNKMNQLLVKSILDKYGVNTVMVENGEEAITEMRSKKFDLILMDVQMPRVDGISATKIYRKEINTTTPIIAMTAHVLPGEREKCIDAGMNDYLSKPLDEDEFIIMVKRYFSLQTIDKSHSPANQKNDWVNLDYLKSICGNNPEKIKLILNELKRQIPQDKEVLKKSISDNDIIGIKRICHHLKSTLSPLLPSSPPMMKLAELSKILNGKASAIEIGDKGKQLASALSNAEDELSQVITNY